MVYPAFPSPGIAEAIAACSVHRSDVRATILGASSRANAIGHTLFIYAGCNPGKFFEYCGKVLCILESYFICNGSNGELSFLQGLLRVLYALF